MTIHAAYRKGIEILKIAGNETSASDAGALLCFVAQCDRAFLYAYDDRELDTVFVSNYFSLLERRACGVPLQYLIGIQEFMSLPFEVGQGVLIPRQETELLVETVINFCKQQAATFSILDIGTGSGCIAVSLSYYLPGCSITALDKMPEALVIAQRNAQVNGVADRIRFVRSNLFEGLAGEKFDVIVSNPPYIRTQDIAGLQTEVRCYEPIEALDGGIDGLDFYRSIVKVTPGYIKADGVLIFETGYDQAVDVAALMSDSFSQITTFKDLSGIDRVVSGCYCFNAFY